MKTLACITILFLGIGILLAQETEVKGQVVQVQEMASTENQGEIIQVRLQTKSQEMIQAQLCPRWFLDKDIENGDELILTGKYMEKNKYMVKEMVKNRVRYRIRGKNFEPLWIKTRLKAERHFYNPKTEKQFKGKIEDLYTDEPSDMMEARIRMEKGKQEGELIRVRLAPEWYLQNRLRIGDEIELRGSEVTSNGEKMIIAREMRNNRTRTELSLRNKQGFPMWRRGKHHHGGPGQGQGGRHGEGHGRGRGHGGSQ